MTVNIFFGSEVSKLAMRINSSCAFPCTYASSEDFLALYKLLVYIYGALGVEMMGNDIANALIILS